ncbi:ThiF family adenylyltransferase [Nocardia sp. NPDC051832]|uniref:ThiF family adenylyltransferase n=1 Tax=Nocardia sp. NPDC051832 TaxID=3155673 RepID=UPI00342993E7
MFDEKTIKPVLKHTSPLSARDGVLYIGGYGEAVEIPDPDGAIERLFELLDGTRSLDEIHETLASRYPMITHADVADAVHQFDEAGFLLDATQTAEGQLDDYELARWERNVNFFGSYAHLADNKYAMQRKLRDTRVTLLGLGGLGTHLLLDMAAMGVGHVRAVEFDTVELSNLNRQILYRDSDIGKPKIEAALPRVREFNPRIELEARPGRIESVEDVVRAAAGSDVVISVADRPKMEIARWVNEGCVRAGVPLITGGLETQRVVYYTVLPGRTGCVECWRSGVQREDDVSTALLQEKRDRRISGDKAAFCPLVTMTTGLLIGELTRLVTGIAPLTGTGRLMEMRFDDFVLRPAEQWERVAGCPVCGSAQAARRAMAAAGSAR